MLVFFYFLHINRVFVEEIIMLFELIKFFVVFGGNSFEALIKPDGPVSFILIRLCFDLLLCPNNEILLEFLLH